MYGAVFDALTHGCASLTPHLLAAQVACTYSNLLALTLTYPTVRHYRSELERQWAKSGGRRSLVLDARQKPKGNTFPLTFGGKCYIIRAINTTKLFVDRKQRRLIAPAVKGYKHKNWPLVGHRPDSASWFRSLFRFQHRAEMSFTPYANFSSVYY